MSDSPQVSESDVLRRDWAEATPRERPPRVLVVDDNRDAAHTLARLLSVLGIATEEANSGAAALLAIERLAIERQAPDLVFLDLGMAPMDGIETARQIKARPEWQSLPLVALTGLGHEHDRERTLAAGFAAHLVKPVNLALLEKTLEAFLDHPAGRAGERSRVGGPANRLPRHV